ncbi:MAG: hypothetical protein ACI9QQ_001424 [Myxococcota bacterium]|jgi:uncharacterized protein (DUF1499 family)
MAESSTPRIASIASTLGKFAPFCVISALLGVQIGVVPPLIAFYVSALGLLVGLLALIIGIVAVIITRNAEDNAGRNAGLVGIVAGAAMFATTAAIVGGGNNAPPINDITTNLDNPPAFATAAEVPDFEGRDMSYPADFVEIVREHYSDLEPIRVSQDATGAYQKAIATAQSLGWEIVHQDPQQLSINARETSSIFKFVDDIVIRVLAEDGGAVIDVRSKSRDGKSDLGINAARIREFAEAINR